MSFEPVDIFVGDVVGDPVEGVLVKVYDPTGSVFYAQATTDVLGRAAFLLETLTYTMRFYKFQAAFKQPQVVTVLTAPAINQFDVVVELLVPPTATDPRLCRCSGYFRDLNGAPRPYLDIHIINAFSPLILDSSAVVASEVHIRTDEKGYAQIDLIRGAEYMARIEAIDGFQSRCIKVPDLAGTNLCNLLFPIVERITWDVPGPLSLAVGAEIVLTPTVYDSAGVPLLGTAQGDVQFSTSASAFMSVLVGATTVTVRGIAPGAAQVLAVRSNKTIIKIPDLPVGGQPIDVTVT